MDFFTWLESQLDLMPLYHGTSSGFLPDIRRDGLVPTKRNDLDYWFKRYFPGEDVPPEIAERAKNSLTISDVHNKIHLTPKFEVAVSYARLLYRFGGENAYIYWKWFNDWTGGDLKPIFHDARPVVVEVRIPTSQLIRKNSAEYLSVKPIPRVVAIHEVF